MSGHPSRGEQVKLLLLPRRGDHVTTRPAELAGAGRAQRAAAATKLLTRPRWLVFHAVVGALVATFVGLGLWQLSVSDAKNFDFFNFQYAVQWWLFAAFGLFVWARVMQYRLNPPQRISPRGGIVVSRGDSRATRSGSTTLMVSTTTNGEGPVVYRGYVAPQSSDGPVRSHGDPLHDAYNNYLWQLGAADNANPDVRATRVDPVGHDGGDELRSDPPRQELD